MFRAAIGLLFILFCWLYWGAANAIEIKNFKSGLVCPDSESGGIGKGHVCFETEVVHVTGQGRCTYNGEDRPCTWYGFEFNYSGAEPGQKISCVLNSSAAVNYGNPDAIIAADTGKFEYELDLENTQGRFFNPQYAILATVSQGARENREETVCSSDGEELFRFKFRFLYPTREDR